MSQTTTPALAQELVSLREKIDALDIPVSRYAGLLLDPPDIFAAQSGGEAIKSQKLSCGQEELASCLDDYFDHQHAKNHHHYVAASLYGPKGQLETLGSRLWLKHDIVPLLKPKNGIKKPSPKTAENLAIEAEKAFGNDDLVDVKLSPLNEVEVAFLVTKDDYQNTTPKAYWQQLEQQVKDFQGKQLLFLSATPQGGGVALMRHALIRLYRLMGVDAHWHVLKERAEVFDITKRKFHNILQAVADKDSFLTKKEQDLYLTWIEENARLLEPVLKSADVIVVDDPQPCGLIPYIRKWNPKARILFRSHIQIEAGLANTPGTPTHKTWQFLWQFIQDHDGYISHPIIGFIPDEVSITKTVLMPATTDPLDGLNKPLTKAQKDYYHQWFSRILLESQQSPLDPDRPYLIQIARFDPSKGIPDVIEAYAHLRDKLKNAKTPSPQLVICGHGSIDDPDGAPIYNLIRNLLKKDRYKDIAPDIKVARLPHSDQMLNTLLRDSLVALQLSHKEGFEIKVTEALMKGKPVISYRRGGIPLQIMNEVNGYVVDQVGDTATVADRLFDLVTDQKLYAQMSQAAAKYARVDVLTVPNATNWLYLANRVIKENTLTTNGKHIRELLFNEA